MVWIGESKATATYDIRYVSEQHQNTAYFPTWAKSYNILLKEI